MNKMFLGLRKIFIKYLILFTTELMIFLLRYTRYLYVSEVISLIPFYFGEQVRYKFYKRTLASCGENVTINFGTILTFPDITIGSHVSLGTYNILGHVDIGDEVMTAQGCYILSGKHQHSSDRTDIPMQRQSVTFERTSIAGDVWLGAGVRVLANIGYGCVIGAGSVVVKDIPDWSVAVGNPAKVIKN